MYKKVKGTDICIAPHRKKLISEALAHYATNDTELSATEDRKYTYNAITYE